MCACMLTLTLMKYTRERGSCLCDTNAYACLSVAQSLYGLKLSEK